MDSVDTVKTAFAGAHMWFEGTVADITAEQSEARPPGQCHSITELIAHVLHCEDHMLAAFVVGTDSLWEREHWSAKTGLPLLVDLPDRPVSSAAADPGLLRDYGRKVFAQTDACLSGLTPAQLEGDVDLSGAGMGKMPLATFLLTMLLGNTYAHTGEISALKGIAGAKGYPF